MYCHLVVEDLSVEFAAFLNEALLLLVAPLECSMHLLVLQSEALQGLVTHHLRENLLELTLKSLKLRDISLHLAVKLCHELRAISLVHHIVFVVHCIADKAPAPTSVTNNRVWRASAVLASAMDGFVLCAAYDRRTCLAS